MEILNQTVINAIFWTLIHSLWQGLILAIFGGLIVLTTKKASSVLRYNLLSLILVIFIIAVGFTFYNQFQNLGIQNISFQNTNATSIENVDSVFKSPAILSSDLITIIVDFLNKNATTITLIWFLIFSIKCFRIFGNLGYVYKIRNYKTNSVSSVWEAKFQELCQLVKVKTPIILLESQLIKVPSVTGFLKPIILIPVGLLSNLPQDQVEVILLHELAHIKRKDYFINIIQSFTEIIFFFNPAVLWVSNILKYERENCCDDIALALTENKSGFVQALVSFQEFNIENSSLVMGFGNHKNHLLNRVKRIIYSDNQTLNTIEKTFLSISFIVILSFVLFTVNAQEVKKTSINVAYQLQKKEMEADKARVEDDKVRVEDDKVRVEDDKARVEDDKARVEDDKASFEADKARVEADKAKIINDKNQEKNKSNSDLQKRINTLELELQKLKSEKDKSNKKTTSKTTTHSEYEKTINDDSGKKLKKIIIKAESFPVNFDDEKLTNSIINDLLQEKIIKNTSNLSYNLSGTELIVNNKKQSQLLHQKLKQKYIKGKEMAICYNFEIKE
ncbi:M56 family metallopeptidase [Flavobacterium sp.]|uniref:M56 family metallopeptidase n=1 Tax=Flavobacterium sp. TaxID=239 RepID=UPI00286E2E42|nr:M56 family metallopeptidase [Flavobacterium sp.]